MKELVRMIKRGRVTPDLGRARWVSGSGSRSMSGRERKRERDEHVCLRACAGQSCNVCQHLKTPYPALSSPLPSLSTPPLGHRLFLADLQPTYLELADSDAKSMQAWAAAAALGALGWGREGDREGGKEGGREGGRGSEVGRLCVYSDLADDIGHCAMKRI